MVFLFKYVGVLLGQRSKTACQHESTKSFLSTSNKVEKVTILNSLSLNFFITVHLFGKNPNPDSESNKEFFVSLVKSKKGLWIQWIRSRRGFNGLIWMLILRICRFCVSLGKDSKKVHVASGLHAKIVAREKSIFVFFVSFAEKNPRLISFRILCFFGKKESVWSHAIIHFWILPKKCTLNES